ncbi:fibroblast growth factor 17-like [Ornithodoros turicata]|uniref:fibroblast growth factor 17-like n=1 Tax=Ornithodoros turicata TaxID=34597 RepID=UPI0031394EAF
MLIFKFVVPITLTLLVSFAMVQCQRFNFEKSPTILGTDDQPSHSVQIELTLFNRCSRGLVLMDGKKVTAAPSNSRFSKLVLTSVGMDSTLTIQSNGTFLCFNKSGRLVNKKRRSKRKSLCEFREALRENYSTFQSVFNSNWYIGFNPSGRAIRGRKTRTRRWRPFMFQKRLPPVVHKSPGPFQDVSEVIWAEYLRGKNAS